MRLKDKTVFITGSSSGIGEACATHFAKEGARLLLCARRVEKVQSLAKRLQKEYNINTHVIELDVRDQKAIQQIYNALPEEWKNLDILVNNAGLAAGLDHFQEGDVDDWERMIDTNVKGLMYVTKAFVPQMIEKKEGHIINIGSIAGRQVYPKGIVYCASKHAVRALTQGLRQDFHGFNIRVSSVDPGAVETEFSQVRFKGDEERAASVYEGYEPLQADDIADAVIYCATRPPHVNISEVLIMPTAQAAASMTYKQKKGQ